MTKPEAPVGGGSATSSSYTFVPPPAPRFGAVIGTDDVTPDGLTVKMSGPPQYFFTTKMFPVCELENPWMRRACRTLFDDSARISPNSLRANVRLKLPGEDSYCTSNRDGHRLSSLPSLGTLMSM